ncbi:hypothetical protein ACQF4J_21740 [Streptomyces sp. C1-1]|uniref:hypothetical protein n=1 Tax=Streptomyces sp. C1-1 TaxID=3231173 RepID=UPI003D08ACAA
MAGNSALEDAVALEIQHVHQLTRSMLDEYAGWGSKISIGDIQQGMYDEVLDFLNFRIETADTCLLLLKNNRVADSLGLSRSLLEHYLLFMLMCRGKKYFKLLDLSGTLTEGQFKVRLQEERQEIEELRTRGKTNYLEVRKYPRGKRHLMYILEGLTNSEEPDFFVPLHYFQFQQFRPETMRLDERKYFQYYTRDTDTDKARREYRDEATLSYRHYLSYDALLQCLELNDLTDELVALRIEAHYTFLGKFLHPTHDAARQLHEQNNVHHGGTVIGMRQPYSKTAELLASLYLCYILAGLLLEAASLIERAPSRFISNAGTATLRELAESVERRFPYFWFLFNDPPLYDRFNYCSSNATSEDWAKWGSYENAPKERIPFNQHIFSNFERSLGSWSNARCGTYQSPIL